MTKRSHKPECWSLNGGRVYAQPICDCRTPIQVAEQFHATLVADSNLYHAGTIDHDEHARRNRITWSRIATSGVADLVDAMLRGEVTA